MTGSARLDIYDQMGDSLAEDVGISPATVKKYIEILAAVYVIFIVRPFSHNIARSLLK